jgi:hypothetical protein
MGNALIFPSDLDSFESDNDTEDKKGTENEDKKDTEDKKETLQKETEMLISYITINDVENTMAIWYRRRVEFDKLQISKILANAYKCDYMDVFETMMVCTDVPVCQDTLQYISLIKVTPAYKIAEYFTDLQKHISPNKMTARIRGKEKTAMTKVCNYCIVTKNATLLRQVVDYLRQGNFSVIIEDLDLISLVNDKYFDPAIVHILATWCTYSHACLKWRVLLTNNQMAKYKEYLALKYKHDLPNLDSINEIRLIDEI